MALRLLARGLGVTLLVTAALASVDANSQPAGRQNSAQPVTKFGIIYSLWHCLSLQRTNGDPWSIAKALRGEKPWGPIPNFHFWDEPKLGYYCLSERADVLRTHAKQLRDAGIDFIVIDATNNEFTDPKRTPDSPEGIIKPLKLMLQEWSKLDAEWTKAGHQGPPKIVPHVPLTRNGDMFEYMMKLIGEHPNLYFMYDNKPLALVATDGNRFAFDTAKYREMSTRYTLRRMWGHRHNSRDPTEWSFLEICQRGFRESQANIRCGQRRAWKDGKVEQISIAAGYQETYMSRIETAVPKFNGRTFVRQFEALFESPNVPIAIIASWNEWMGQRFCLNGNDATDKNCNLANDHFPNGWKVFVDTYADEYNRDIEPTKGKSGDFYYRLLKACITKYRKGEMCKVADANQTAAR